MKTLKRILLVLGIGIVGFTIYIFVELQHGFALMGDNSLEHFSNSVAESKENNLFLGYYRPLKDTIILDSFKVKSQRIWYEKNWTTDHTSHYWGIKKVLPSINIIFPDTKILASELYIDAFIKVGINKWNESFKWTRLGYAFINSNAPDTITLLLSTDSCNGHKDSINYVKE